ncbi:hypothetical protein DM02DRAFT_362095 [Periconia macrospinosa]|uniref:Uncharacterized protein n=1 Tax=Periconia macrospinosa TaxID=97972 RepID=A0A2V1D0X1_9PLEO|nr:hypothetical protein DM02DRAFT_362095 [Periconia macrospinosa]
MLFRSRRAANNNYQKLTKALHQKLTKLCLEYDNQVYFLAYRNGRFSGCVSANEAGQPWLSPGQETLVRLFFYRITHANGCKGENVPPAHYKITISVPSSAKAGKDAIIQNSSIG